MKKSGKKSGSTTTRKETEKNRREILLLFTETELSAIVKVESTCQDPDNPFRVTVFCKALDSFGLVYDLELKFSSETAEEKKKALAKFKKGSIHLVKGRYNVFKKTF